MAYRETEFAAHGSTLNGNSDAIDRRSMTFGLRAEFLIFRAARLLASAAKKPFSLTFFGLNAQADNDTSITNNRRSCLIAWESEYLRFDQEKRTS
jgi:hypothetical protein